MAGVKPMEEKREKRLVVLSSGMFAVAVVFFWIAMPAEIFASLTRNTAVAWITGDIEGYRLLSRIRLAIPLAAILGGIVAFIMSGLFAYHRYRAAFNLRKENPEGAFYPEDSSNQVQEKDLFEDNFSSSDLREARGVIIDNDEIILMPAASENFSAQEERFSFEEQTKSQAAVIILDNKASFSEADNETPLQSDNQTEADIGHKDLKEDVLSLSQTPLTPVNEEQGKSTPNNSIGTETEEAITLSVNKAQTTNLIEHNPKAEETLFLSSEQILQNPIQDSPYPVSAPPTTAIKLSQLDRDQALHQALALIKEMREQLISATELQ